MHQRHRHLLIPSQKTIRILVSFCGAMGCAGLLWVSMEPNRPKVTAIMLAHNNKDVTVRAIHSVLGQRTTFGFELIVVNDHSSDMTREALDSLTGLKVIHLKNGGPKKYGGAMNIGIAAASVGTEAFWLLNNDIVAHPDALQHLFLRLKSSEDIGMVGPRFINADGRTIQEACAVIFRDGRGGWITKGFPGGANFRHFTYEYARPVDYCSAAAVLVSARVFQMSGAFDSKKFPMYYEDTDLAMRIRELRLHVIYEPEAIVVHIRHASSVSSQARLEALENGRKRFVTEWDLVLKEKHQNKKLGALCLRDRRPGKRIAILAADSIPREVVESLNNQGFVITLVCTKKAISWQASAQRRGMEVIPVSVGYESHLRERTGFYEAIISTKRLPNAQSLAKNVPFVLLSTGMDLKRNLLISPFPSKCNKNPLWENSNSILSCRDRGNRTSGTNLFLRAAKTLNQNIASC